MDIENTVRQMVLGWVSIVNFFWLSWDRHLFLTQTFEASPNDVRLKST